MSEEKDVKDTGKQDNNETLLKTRSILISGEIDKKMAEKVVSQLLMLEADSAYAIFDMIRFVKPKVTMIAMGLAASAGALILLAGDKENRFGFPNSHYLIHQPLSGIRGVATEIEIHAKEIEKTRQKINALIAKETGKSLAQVEKDTDRDYWMSAEEALDYGLISKIISNRSQLA